MLASRRLRATLVGAAAALLVIIASADYQVRRGDTLSEIARDHGISVAALAEANELSDPDLIRSGERLLIPGEDGSAASVHVVASGENLAEIAGRYDTTASALAEANDLTDSNLIHIGQELAIPAGGSGEGAGETVGYHMVEAGDTLASIARRYGVTVAQLAEANGITNLAQIFVGTRLELSGSAFVAEPETSDGEHVVAAGENLAGIAAHYGVTASAIANANDIDDPDRIQVGQRLTIPEGGSDWVCPVAGASYFNDWGFPRSGGRFHEGNDLFAPRGSEVRAPVSGTVEFHTGVIGGLQFRLQGDDGVTYIGTHMEAFGRSGRVPGGGVIGYVGDTGNARGSNPHLHFEIHPGDDGPVNPYPTLQENC